MRGKVWIATGLLLMTAALFLTAFNLWEGKRAQDTAESAVLELEALIPEAEDVLEQTAQTDFAGETEIPDYLLNPEMDMPVQTLDGEDYIGVLEIPALQLELPVLSEWSYDRLKIAPCRYAGSAYLKNMILCAHNYPSHFADLQSLRSGDSVTFTDVDGNAFVYRVVEIETIPSGGVEQMESGDWDLTLFTCNFSGQSRVTVRCEAVEG